VFDRCKEIIFGRFDVSIFGQFDSSTCIISRTISTSSCTSTSCTISIVVVLVVSLLSFWFFATWVPMTMPTVNINRSAIAIPTAIHRLRLDHIVIAVEVLSVLEEARGACSDAVVGACSTTVTVLAWTDSPIMRCRICCSNSESEMAVAKTVALAAACEERSFSFSLATFGLALPIMEKASCASYC
jgi:hypothetical protein